MARFFAADAFGCRRKPTPNSLLSTDRPPFSRRRDYETLQAMLAPPFLLECAERTTHARANAERQLCAHDCGEPITNSPSTRLTPHRAELLESSAGSW